MTDLDGSVQRADTWLQRLWRKRWARWLTVLLVLPAFVLIAIAIYGAIRLADDTPVVYADIEEHFKYGSTGGERESGFPYWIFQAMPQRLRQAPAAGQGYASLGLIFEEGKDLPVGMSKRALSGRRPHVPELRRVPHQHGARHAADAKPRVVLGMPANTFNIFAFQKFVFDCAHDPQFATEYVVPEIDRLMRAKGERLGLLDRYVVYPIAVALMRERLLMLHGRFEPLLTRHAMGPRPRRHVQPDQGAVQLSRWTSCPRTSGTPPSTSRRSGCRSRARACSCTGTATTSMSEERNKSAAFGTGTTPPTIDLAAIARARGAGSRPRSRRSIRTRSMPRRPQRGDDALRAVLRRLPRRERTRLHRAGGHAVARVRGHEEDERSLRPQVGKVTRIEDVGTDRHRLDSYTYDLAVEPGHRSTPAIRTASATSARPSATPTCRSTACGCARPYLHNGSVPTLRDLLEPAAEAPEDVLSRQRRLRPEEGRLRVRACPRRAGATFFLYDTRMPGNAQRRPRGQGLRHRAFARGQGRAGRVSEDVLRDPPWTSRSTRPSRGHAGRKLAAHSWTVAARSLAVLAVGGSALVGWYKFFREEPQPDWITQRPGDALQVRLDRRRARRRHSVLDLLRAAAHLPGEAARARRLRVARRVRGSRARSCRSASRRR